MSNEDSTLMLEHTHRNVNKGRSGSSECIPMEPADTTPPQEHGSCEKVWHSVKGHALIIMTLVGVLAGFLIGFAVRTVDPSDTALTWLGSYTSCYVDRQTDRQTDTVYCLQWRFVM